MSSSPSSKTSFDLGFSPDVDFDTAFSMFKTEFGAAFDTVDKDNGFAKEWAYTGTDDKELNRQIHEQYQRQLQEEFNRQLSHFKGGLPSAPVSGQDFHASLHANLHPDQEPFVNDHHNAEPQPHLQHNHQLVHHPVGSSTSPGTSTAQLNGLSASPFASLLNEQESWALSEFLDKVSVDPNFLFDPKLADGLLNVEFDPVESFGAAHHQHAPPPHPPPTHVEKPHEPHEPHHHHHHHHHHQPQKLPNPHPPLAFASDPNFPPIKKEPTPPLSPVEAASAKPYPDALKKPRAKSVSTASGKVRTTSSRRDYLSETQKRMNHISSEKRRRDLIKRQFDKMCSLVPTLVDGSATTRKSKSDILMVVYEYLVALSEQNRSLRQALLSSGVPESELPKSSV
ncbi:hypothetical protein TRVA0_030S00166 [Trichomonascus vanleenenianus]|uniref:uncharacterized protein n=1 Tax=Trichomonascus vanleenenianus TaxID=2268995 RepID=UPI003ECAD373